MITVLSRDAQRRTGRHRHSEGRGASHGKELRGVSPQPPVPADLTGGGGQVGSRIAKSADPARAQMRKWGYGGK